MTGNKLTVLAQRPDGFARWLLLIFVVVSLVGVNNHELWRDEFQGWLIASDSHTVLELLQNQRYESGRSLFSFFGFWVVSRWSRHPLMMQLFHLGMAATTVYLIARFSPFTRLQKVGLAFSYFLFFEYSLICRDYAPGVLCIVIFCTLFPFRDRTRLPLAGCLFLAANTLFYALLVTVPLGLVLFLHGSNLSQLSKNSLSSCRVWNFIG